MINYPPSNGESGAGNHLPRTEADTAMILDEDLSSAAAPFLYLLGSIIVAGMAYLIYSAL